MRISNDDGCLKHLKKFDKKMKVGGNELKGIDEVYEAVTVVLAMLYDGEMSDENRTDDKCDGDVDDEIEHRVASPRSKGGVKKRGGSKAFELMSATSLTKGWGVTLVFGLRLRSKANDKGRRVD